MAKNSNMLLIGLAVVAGALFFMHKKSNPAQAATEPTNTFLSKNTVTSAPLPPATVSTIHQQAMIAAQQAAVQLAQPNLTPKVAQAAYINAVNAQTMSYAGKTVYNTDGSLTAFGHAIQATAPSGPMTPAQIEEAFTNETPGY